MSPHERMAAEAVEAETAVDAPSVTILGMARHARSQYRRTFEGAADDVVRMPDGAVMELIDALARTATNSVKQIVPFSCYRAADDFSLRVWRGVAAASERPVALQRLYVIPPGGDPQRAVDRQIQADHDAGAEARQLHLGTGGLARAWTLDVDMPLSELWLIDGCAVVRKEVSGHAPPVWVVSTREGDVRKAAKMWRLWEEPASSSHTDRGEPDLTEPLLESARMLHAMAPMSCTRDHVDRVSCSWYHGAWQYLRLFDMVSSPSWHSQFYRTWLSDSLAGDGPRRVLITGAADYSLLAYVIAAARANGKLDAHLLQTHVMDLCPTPLNACRWYADRFGLDIALHEVDILDEAHSLVRRIQGCEPQPGEGFDLIATDAFLTRFARDDVGRVLENWRALLRPGGRVITTIRLHPCDTPRRMGESSGLPQELIRYTLRLRERALGWRSIIGIDLDTLVSAARDYTMRITSTDIGDRGDVIDLVSRHGFETIHVDSGPVDGELVPTEYLRLVLTSS